MVEFAGFNLEPDDIVDFLRQNLRLRSLCQEIVEQRLLVRTAHERNLQVTASEIQEDANRMRYELRLESADRTLEWLNEQLSTVEDWEIGIRDRLLAKKLQNALFTDDIERVFVQSRLDFEQILLYRIRVPYQPLAQELYYQIEEAEISFYEAAHLYDMDEQRRLRCGYDGRLHRWDFEPDVAAALFGSSVGAVLGPFPVSQGYDLLMVSDFIPAELTDETRDLILERMSREWLESELNYWTHNHNHENQG
jgi:parvulin-like peptidyl-prolyl isomerase